MAPGNSNLVRENSILWPANQMVSVPSVKTLTAHSSLAGTADYNDLLMAELKRIHFQVSPVNSEPKEFSVIAMVVCGSELQIGVLYMHTRERRMCMAIPKDCQATTFTLFLKIWRRTFG